MNEPVKTTTTETTVRHEPHTTTGIGHPTTTGTGLTGSNYPTTGLGSTSNYPTTGVGEKVSDRKRIDRNGVSFLFRLVLDVDCLFPLPFVFFYCRAIPLKLQKRVKKLATARVKVLKRWVIRHKSLALKWSMEFRRLQPVSRILESK